MKDMKAIFDLIDSSARWLRETKSTDQWARPWPNKTERDIRISRGIVGGSTWMVEGNEGLAGTITYRDKGNPQLWTEYERSENAVYISRLIVSRQHARREIGAALIEWAGMRAMERWAADWIRVDVWTTNLALHGYYKGRGFEHLRTLQFADPWDYPSAALFQKPTSNVDMTREARFEEEEVS